jgi:murein tripeptide amidase MpaA
MLIDLVLVVVLASPLLAAPVTRPVTNAGGATFPAPAHANPSRPNAANAPAPLDTIAPGSAARALPPPGTSVTSADVPSFWRTRAEKTGYRETPDLDETVRYCKQIEAASTWVRVTTFGTSAQGRELPLVILSKQRAFTPEAAAATGKPVVLILNGIHSGEIEGKDACLALMRDMTVNHTHAALLDSVIVLVVPVFSVDAHERHSAYNRINQNGPTQMGWRSNAQGLNLNRDWLKVETPEMRALLANVYTKWWPHLLVDDHTTDGADYQHDLTYSVDHGPEVPHAIARWMAEAVATRADSAVAAMGHLPAPYLNFRGDDPRSGIADGDAPPRFSNGYPVLRGRAAVLTETHMLKSYDVRVKATYDWLVALLDEVHDRPRALLNAVAESEKEIVALGSATGREVPLAGALTDSAGSFRFRGYAWRRQPSDILGAPVIRWTSTVWDSVIPWYHDERPDHKIRVPAGYVVPAEWTIVRDRLQVHGIRFRTLARAWTDSVEVQRVANWSAGDLFEGHHPVTAAHVVTERRLRTFRPGDLWVPLDQPAGLIAMELLDAAAPEGLLYWNAFDTVLSPKEYAEVYVMEPVARAMLMADPQFATEFHTKVASDTAFAHSPFARSDWLYRHSKWADPDQDLSPIARALRRPPENVLAK